MVELTLRMDNLIPVKFHPYPSTVIDRLITIGNADGKLYKVEQDFIQLFTKAGIQCAVDNKIVFECIECDVVETMYFGFKDGCFSIGYNILKGR